MREREFENEHKPRLVRLPEADALTADMDEMDRDLPQLKRLHRNRAVLYRDFFNALVEQGFSEAQALELSAAEFTA